MATNHIRKPQEKEMRPMEIGSRFGTPQFDTLARAWDASGLTNKGEGWTECRGEFLLLTNHGGTLMVARTEGHTSAVLIAVFPYKGGHNNAAYRSALRRMTAEATGAKAKKVVRS